MTIQIIIILLLLLVGISLLIAETFFIPGFGIVGILGIAFFAGGIMEAYSFFGAKVGTIVLSLSLILTAGVFIGLIKSKALDKVSLRAEINSSVGEENIINIEVGERGTTISRLNPIGKAMIRNQIVEAKSDSGFIDENTEIEVIKVTKTNILVKPIV